MYDRDVPTYRTDEYDHCLFCGESARKIPPLTTHDYLRDYFAGLISHLFLLVCMEVWELFVHDQNRFPIRTAVGAWVKQWNLGTYMLRFHAEVRIARLIHNSFAVSRRLPTNYISGLNFTGYPSSLAWKGLGEPISSYCIGCLTNYGSFNKTNTGHATVIMKYMRGLISQVVFVVTRM